MEMEINGNGNKWKLKKMEMEKEINGNGNKWKWKRK